MLKDIIEKINISTRYIMLENNKYQLIGIIDNHDKENIPQNLLDKEVLTIKIVDVNIVKLILIV